MGDRNSPLLENTDQGEKVHPVPLIQLRAQVSNLDDAVFVPTVVDAQLFFISLSDDTQTARTNESAEEIRTAVSIRSDENLKTASDAIPFNISLNPDHLQTILGPQTVQTVLRDIKENPSACVDRSDELLSEITCPTVSDPSEGVNTARSIERMLPTTRDEYDDDRADHRRRTSSTRSASDVNTSDLERNNMKTARSSPDERTARSLNTSDTQSGRSYEEWWWLLPIDGIDYLSVLPSVCIRQILKNLDRPAMHNLRLTCRWMNKMVDTRANAKIRLKEGHVHLEKTAVGFKMEVLVNTARCQDMAYEEEPEMRRVIYEINTSNCTLTTTTSFHPCLGVEMYGKSRDKREEKIVFASNDQVYSTREGRGVPEIFFSFIRDVCQSIEIEELRVISIVVDSSFVEGIISSFTNFSSADVRKVFFEECTCEQINKEVATRFIHWISKPSRWSVDCDSEATGQWSTLFTEQLIMIPFLKFVKFPDVVKLKLTPAGTRRVGRLRGFTAFGLKITAETLPQMIKNRCKVLKSGWLELSIDGSWTEENLRDALGCEFFTMTPDDFISEQAEDADYLFYHEKTGMIIGYETLKTPGEILVIFDYENNEQRKIL